jgi:hypothetical protein
MSLLVTNLVGFGSGEGRTSVTTSYAGFTNSPDVGYPTLTVPTGTAAVDRYVIVIVYADNNSGGLFGTMTLGGIACTKIVANPVTAGACAIYITDTPLTTGTTASLVLEGGADVDLAFATYAAYGINPTATDTLAVASNDPTGTIDVPAGGIMIAGSLCEDDESSCTWTGVTEAFDTVFGGTKGTAGSYTTAVAVTGRTVKADWSSSFADKMVAAS